MCSRKISIFIPVYRESDLLEHLLTSLINDPYKDKEIFVVIDEPTERSLEVSKRFSEEEVHFKFNGIRRGKANVLNEVVSESKGEVLLFLDSDTLIDGGKKNSFLETIVREMGDAEIVEIKKEVIKDSFIARIISYDYLGFSLTNFYFSERIKRCLGINGAAFAMRREVFEALGGFRRVICEDLDIAVRSFIKGARFKFLKDITVYTKAPSSWRGWFEQRKRWGVGAAFWVREHFKTLKTALCKHPEVVIPSLLFIFPALPIFLFSLFIPDELSIKILYTSLILLSTKTNLLIPPAALTSTALSTLKSISTVIGSLIGYMIVFYLIARKFQSYFNPLDFTAFYFVMAPLWLLIILGSLIKVYIEPKKVDVNWKV